MGLFSSIKKLVKKVVGGVKKVFKGVAKVVGKVLNSGLGKVIMGALTVVSLGSALIAGASTFASGMAAGQGFVSSFIEGGKAFLTSMTGIGQKPAGKVGGAAGKTSEVVAQSGETLGKINNDVIQQSLMQTSQKLGEVVPDILGAPGSGGTLNVGMLEDAVNVATGGSATLGKSPMAAAARPELIEAASQTAGNVLGEIGKTATTTPAGTAGKGLSELEVFGGAGDVATETMATRVATGAPSYTPPAKEPGLFGKAMGVVDKIGKFANDNPGLIEIGGRMLAGYSQGKMAEKAYERQIQEERRMEQLWSDFDVGSLYQTTRPSNMPNQSTGTNGRPIYAAPFERLEERRQQRRQERRVTPENNVQLSNESLLGAS